MQIKFPIPIALFSSLFMMGNFSCGNSNENGKILAKVGDKILYASTLSQYYAGADSVEFKKKFTSNWIQSQILNQYASQNSAGPNDIINEKVEKFRADLQLAEYEKEFISKNLDTNVTSKQIAAFYSKNKGMFELRDYVVSVFYMKFDISEKNNAKIGLEFKKCAKIEDAKKIEEKYSSLSVNSFLEPNSWIFFTDLLREIPINVDDKLKFLQNNSYFETTTEDDIYFVRIFNYKMKDEISPINLVQKKIKTLILIERSQQIIAANRIKIIKQFNDNNDVQNYTK